METTCSIEIPLLPVNMIRTAVLACLLNTPASANDGFFQGAGDTLRPVTSSALRVVRETLTLDALDAPRCYELLYRGKASQPGPDYDYKAGEFARPGHPVLCETTAGVAQWPTFEATWHAKAVYEIEALDQVSEIVFGFPTSVWDAEFQDANGLNSIGAAGVADFHTYIDGTEVHEPELKWLEGVSKSKDKKLLGFTWKASFSKGGRHVLITEYDMGVDISNAFYADREYPKSEPPWFLGKPEEAWNPEGSRRVIYYLTPLRQWAGPPPERVSIVATLPRAVPMIAAVPLRPKPRCVGERSLFYELRDRFPDQDLELSYAPFADFSTHHLETAADLEAWTNTIGGAEINCALLSRLKAGASPEVALLLAKRSCVKTCRQ